MSINYYDDDTLAVARLVADAEGIDLATALADQYALFGEHSEDVADGVEFDEWLAEDTYLMREGVSW